MKIKAYGDEIGNANPGTRKAYKADPGNFQVACEYGVALARRRSCEAVIIPGNSYMQPIFYVVPLADDLRTYTAGARVAKGATVTESGRVRHAILEA